jgi:hypothetical protein
MAPESVNYKWKEALASFIQIFGLSGFALLPPLYRALTKSQPFFVAHQAGASDIVCFALIMGVLFPSILAALIALTALFGKKVNMAVRAFAVSMLVMFFLLPTFKTALPLPGIAVFIALWIPGAIVAYFYAKHPKFQSYTTFLTPISLAFSVMFLMQSEIVFPAKHKAAEQTGEISGGSGAPAICLVMDEFALDSILGADGEIDAKLFPNFARLAKDGVWMRDATTISETTELAVPSILTGKNPVRADAAPNLDNYPQNMFTILNAAGYQIHAFECATALCPKEINKRETRRPPFMERIHEILTDVSVFAGHQFLPKDFTKNLPSIDARVAHFTKTVGDSSNEKAKQTDVQLGLFDDFLSTIGPEPRSLYFAHIELPHVPYQFLPSGKYYTRSLNMPGWHGDFVSWDKNQGHEARAQQRYLLQSRFTDLLIGQLLDKLEKQGTYQDSFLAIIADHGVSYRIGAPRRGVNITPDGVVDARTSNLDVLKIPVFIKLPKKGPASPFTNKFQSPDILPTMCGALEITGAGPFDGRDVFSNASTPEHFAFFNKSTNSIVKHDLSLLNIDYVTTTKQNAFDVEHGFGIRSDVYDQLCGKSTKDAATAEPSELNAELFSPENYETVGAAPDFLPAMLQGTLQNNASNQPRNLAVALNGVFVAVTNSFDTGRGVSEFSAMLPEENFRNGRNEIALFEITRNPANEITLKPLASTLSPIADYALDFPKRQITRKDNPQPISIAPSALRSYIGAEPNQNSPRFVFNGWVVDLARKDFVPESIVLFMKNKPVIWTQVDRHAYTQELPKDALLNRGFELGIDKQKLEGIESLDDLELFALGKNGVAQRMLLGDISKVVCTKMFPGLPEFRVPEKVVRSWDFTNPNQDIINWNFLGKTSEQDRASGLSFDVSGSMPVLLNGITLNSNQVAAIRIEAAIQTITPAGPQAIESLGDIRVYWARQSDITKENQGWPFAETMAVSATPIDPVKPGVRIANIHRHTAWDGEINRLMFSFKLSPNQEQRKADSKFKIMIRKIELLGQ